MEEPELNAEEHPKFSSSDEDFQRLNTTLKDEPQSEFFCINALSIFSLF